MESIMGVITGELSNTMKSDGEEIVVEYTADKLSTSRTIDGVDFDGSKNIIHWGRCDTDEYTLAKTVSCGGYHLADGSRIIVLFAYSHLGDSGEFSLNVNNTGARPIFYRHDIATVDTFKIVQGDTYEFIYDGTHNVYRVVGDYDTDTTYELATTDSDGLMSKEDKVLLNEIVATIADLKNRVKALEDAKPSDVVGSAIVGTSIVG